MEVRTESVSAAGKAKEKGKGLLWEEQKGPCDERGHKRQGVCSVRISTLDFILSAAGRLDGF